MATPSPLRNQRAEKQLQVILDKVIDAKLRALPAAMEEIRVNMHNKILEKARRELKSSYPDFADSLKSHVDRAKGQIIFSLESPLSNMLEFGARKFDMIPILLRGRSYRRIFIPAGSSGLGQAAITSHPKLALKAMNLASAGGRVHMPAQAKMSGHWKFGAFYNMNVKRNAPPTPKKPTAKSMAAGYGVFRTISAEHSNPESWKHPGIKSKRIVRLALRNTKLVVQRALQKHLG